MRESWATNDGLRLELVEWRPSAPEDGRGTPVVCVHGALGSAWNWESEGEAAAAGRLGRRPRQLAALSRRGMGRSDAPLQGYGLNDFVGDVRAAVRAMAYQRFVLVAHSLGVPLVIAYASRHPVGVAGLVLGDYGPRYPALDDAWVRQIAGRYRSFPSWEAAYESVVGKTANDASERAHFARVKHRYFKEMPTGEIVSAFSMDGVRRMRDDSRQTDLDEMLPAIRCPVLVITGDGEDALLTPALRQRYEDGLADVRFATIPGAGHSLTVAGSSEPFQRTLGSFLVQVDRRT